MTAWAIYVRRSRKGDQDVDISDAAQESIAHSRVPEGADVIVFRDSGGHNSGGTDQRPQYQAMMAAIRDGRIADIAAYKGDRLHRNTENPPLPCTGNVPYSACRS